MNVLIIDDEQMIRDLAGRILKKAGFTIATAENGQIGIELVEASPFGFDLIIVDMFMGEISGIDTISKIHQINPAVNFILSSGNSITKEDIPIELGTQISILQKPYRPKILTELALNLVKPLSV